jgi:cytochrome oxidase Cu insertion factor (SCO1/SenC/PrrC family)
MPNSTRSLKPAIIFGLITLLVAAGLLFYALRLTSPRDMGVALVGGPFTMVNHKGETVTEKSFAGKPMLLFFGFTFCPDVCPTELQVMAAAITELGEKGKDIQPILVSIDPARDTPEVLAAYVGNFGDRFVGLTGTPEQVAEMAKIYRVFYEKQENKADPASYLMDHTSIIYLMGPDGKFLKHFSYTTDAGTLAKGLREALNRP